MDAIGLIFYGHGARRNRVVALLRGGEPAGVPASRPSAPRMAEPDATPRAAFVGCRSVGVPHRFASEPRLKILTVVFRQLVEVLGNQREIAPLGA